MKYDPHKPYNQLPLVPPKEEIETPAVLKKTIAAGRENLYLNVKLYRLLSQ
jgi:hypothetical protein